MSTDPAQGQSSFLDPRSPRVLAVVLALCALTMMGVMSYPFLQGKLYVEDDISSVFVPFRYFYWEALHESESFLWTPDVYNGFYLHGESQNAMVHPLHYLLYKFLPFVPAFDLEILLNYPLMFAGSIFFLRRFGLPPHAALFGALLFTFSGYSTSRWVYISHIATLAYAPWCLFCVDVVMRSKRAGPIALGSFGMVVFTTLMFLSGYPHIAFIVGLAEGLYALFLLRDAPHKAAILLLLTAKILAVGCAAVQLLPTYELAMNSTRTGLDMHGRMWGSQHPANLLQFVNPYFAQQRTYLYHGYDTYYQGAAITLLVAWLFLRFRRLEIPKTPVLCFALVGFIGLVFSLGEYGYIYKSVASLPVFDMFRGAARHIVMVHIALVVLASLAYFELYKVVQRGERVAWKELLPLTVLPLLSCGVAAAVYYVHKNADSIEWAREIAIELAPTRNAIFGAIIMTTTTGLFFLAARGRRLALLALLVFTFADLSWYGLRHKTVVDFDEYMASIEVPADAPGAYIEPNFLPTWNIMGPLMKGYRTPEGRASIEPARRLKYYLDEPSLRLAGVTWLRARYGTNRELNAAFEQGIEWIEIPGPMPRARLLTDTRVTDDPAKDLEEIDMAATALVDNPVVLDGGPPGKAWIVEEEPGRIRVGFEAPGRQLLALTETWYPGWHATQDGEALDTIRVNGDFVGCIVGPGTGEVELFFSPDSWRYGKLITFGSILLTLAFHLGLFARMTIRQGNAHD